MANNRLYIVDPTNGDYFMLCKSMGDGWYPRGQNEGEPTFAERLEQWMDGRDIDAAYTNPGPSKTRLILMCENDPAFAKVSEQ